MAAPAHDPESPVVHVVDDDRFGAIEIVLVHGRSVVVRGQRIPTASIERIAGDATETTTIGTRDADRLVTTLDHRALEVRPGRGRITRRSFRVVVRDGGETWLLTPATSTTSRLVRGARYDGRNELAMLTRDVDGSVVCDWSETVSLGRVQVEAPEPTPDEAALGYLLAAAFHTGAGFAIMHVLDHVEMLLPG